jgi:transmembrane 9 superfamily protein 2/4
MTRLTATLAVLAAACASTASAFYMPGVKPSTFKAGADIELKVNAMTSIHTQIPKPYYRLPFCQPEDGPKMASENLGEFLTGNKIQNSPYIINMKEDRFCTKLCQRTFDKGDAMLLRKHILYGYHNNWIVDNMPSASIGYNKSGQHLKHYAGGFPIGYFNRKTKDVFVFNHVKITLDYHEPEGISNQYRVVGFTVEPFSIDHSFNGGYKWDGESKEGFNKSLSTCMNDKPMNRNAVTSNQIVGEGEEVLFTYDVVWKESDIAWSSRWDIYLNEGDLIPSQVHWYSISNSIFVVVFLSLLVISILVRNLKKDIAEYNSALLDDEEGEAEVDESGWKLVHADVFRPPSNQPMLYCVLMGSGVQLAVSTLFAICLAAIGFINPSRRGSMMNNLLVLYMLCGILAGYTSSRLYKAFRGRAWQVCTFATAVLFPGTCFSMFIFFNTVLAFFRSSGSVPFLDILIVAAMWCCVSIPLVFIGAYFGYKTETIEFPTVTSTIARAIPPPTSITMHPKFLMAVAGLIPFGAAYVELFFILTSLWMDQYYYVFGFTLVVYLILLITSAEITTLIIYYQLVSENHRWWWTSMLTGGSVSVYIFAYSVIWFQSLEPSKLLFTYILYFGYMFLLCFTVFLVTGAFSSMTALWFMKKVFGSIKVD